MIQPLSSSSLRISSAVAQSFAALAASAPEVLCAMPCGFTLEQTYDEMTVLLAKPLWRDLPAVRSSRIFALDGSAYFNRPGPRLAESAEILAAILHPETLSDLMVPGAVRQLAAA